MTEFWPLVALLYTFIGAAYMMTNEVFKQDGSVAVFWRSLFAVVVLSPFALFADWPDEPSLYVFVLVSGLVASIGDVLLFQAVKHHGGSVLSRIGGLRPLLLFFMWPVFHPGGLAPLLASPVLGAGILACLLVSALALFSARHNHVSRAAFITYLPILFLYAFSDIAFKMAVPFEAGADRLIIIAFLCAVIMVAVSGVSMLVTGTRKIILPERLWLSAGINGALFIAICVVKSYGLSITPNPTYFNALSLISVVWTYLIHRFLFRKEDNASPMAGFVIVASAAILTILVGMLPQ